MSLESENQELMDEACELKIYLILTELHKTSKDISGSFDLIATAKNFISKQIIYLQEQATKKAKKLEPAVDFDDPTSETYRAWSFWWNAYLADMVPLGEFEIINQKIKARADTSDYRPEGSWKELLEPDEETNE